jgi:CubicO group peptidase (beta-lactamase class C family)
LDRRRTGSATIDGWSSKFLDRHCIGLLLDDSRNHKLPHDARITLDTSIYDHVPEGFPLSDPAKKDILLRHILFMSSGILGEDHGLSGLSSAPGGGDFEIALGKQADRFGYWASHLTSKPGTAWEYSDAGFEHLSLFCYHVTGREIADMMKERVFDPIGVENFSCARQGGVAGNIGPHTNPHSGLRFSARDFARVGYLMAHRGKWGDKQIVPDWWVEEATKSSQQINPSYGSIRPALFGRPFREMLLRFEIYRGEYLNHIAFPLGGIGAGMFCIWSETSGSGPTNTSTITHAQPSYAGGSHYPPQGSKWYFPQGYRNDQHGKLLLTSPRYDRSGAIGFRCVKD